MRLFPSEWSKLEAVSIVDTTVAYYCPYTMKTYILAVKNALHVPSMERNLVPPFILREAGLVVNDMPKIHIKQDVLSINTHCVVASEENSGIDLRIPMQLDGIFSYFAKRKLTQE